MPFRTLLLFEGSFVGLFASASNFFFCLVGFFYFLFCLLLILSYRAFELGLIVCECSDC